MSKYFKCEYWYGHFPCYSVIAKPEPYITTEESSELLIGLLTGKKKGMEGIMVWFPIKDKEVDEFDKLKERSQKYYKEFALKPGYYKKLRRVERNIEICPEKSITLYMKKKRKSKSTSKKESKKND